MDPIIRQPVASKRDSFANVLFHRSDSKSNSKSDVKHSYVESETETLGSNDPPSTTAVESRWGIGWQTVTIMVSFYILALIIALMHLTMFLALDGKQTDQEGILQQTHVAALSTLLVTLFGICLTISLGVAFTQYLWYLLRHKPMTASTIETLFGIRANPLLLFQWSGWDASPIACTMATIAFLLAIVKIFPPGALTVESRRLGTMANSSVPTFKPDDTRNGSWSDAISYSLASSKVYSSLWRYSDLSPKVGRLASTTLSTGEVLQAPSPCGTNCTYELSFEGPHMICNNFTETVIRTPVQATETGEIAHFDHYSAGLHPDNLQYVPARTNASDDTYSDLIFPFLSINMTWPVGGLTNKLRPNDYQWIVANRTRHECYAGIVTYDLKVRFENGVRSLFYSKRDDVRKVSDTYEPLVGHRVGSWTNTTLPKEWTEVEIAGLKFTNMWALFDSVAQALKGWYPMYINKIMPSDRNAPEEVLNITLTNGSVIAYQPAERIFNRIYFAKLKGMNGTVVESTRLNRNRDNFGSNTLVDIDVSHDLLNEMVANVTLSLIFSIPLSNLETRVTTWSSHNFYQFSYPLNLYLPYGASLLLTLPFLILGIAALRQNGVPAIDGSFLQLLMTTTASKRLNMKAAGGCLGGENNIPEALKHEKILFGELEKSNDDLKSPKSPYGNSVRVAGFGLEDEVIPLKRGAGYGVDP